MTGYTDVSSNTFKYDVLCTVHGHPSTDVPSSLSPVGIFRAYMYPLPKLAGALPENGLAVFIYRSAS